MMKFNNLKDAISNGDYSFSESIVLPPWEDIYETFLTDCIEAISLETGAKWSECFELYKLTKEIIQNLGIKLNLNTIDSQMKLVTTLELVCKMADM